MKSPAHFENPDNKNKASNAKIGQNVNKAVYFFARFFRVNLVVCFDSILPKYTSALLFGGINPSPEHHRELFIRKSNMILIEILLTISCVVVVFLNAKIYVFALYKMEFHCLVIIIYIIGHYFLPIAYVIIILTQRLVPEG
jgi:uncharacterized membrane protein